MRSFGLVCNGSGQKVKFYNLANTFLHAMNQIIYSFSIFILMGANHTNALLGLLFIFYGIKKRAHACVHHLLYLSQKKKNENQVIKKILCLLSDIKRLHQIENNFTRSWTQVQFKNYIVGHSYPLKNVTLHWIKPNL